MTVRSSALPPASSTSTSIAEPSRTGVGPARPKRPSGVLATLLLLFFTALTSRSASAREVGEISVLAETKLLPTDGTAGDSFGCAVALTDELLLVGACFDDEVGVDSGSVYVFEDDGGGWEQTDKLLPATLQTVGSFGYALSQSGDTLLVGAEHDNDNGTSSPAGYVFVHDAGSWTQQRILLGGAGGSTDWFHVSVSLSGDTALIGAWRDEQNGYLSGAVWVFVRDGTQWSEEAQLRPADGEAFDAFGFSVAVSGDTALVGALGDDDNGSFSGSAYVFARDAGIWTEQAKLLPELGAPHDNFGREVSLSGDTALISSPRDDENGDSAGAAYVFTREGETWTQQAKLLAADGEAGDTFGHGDLSGDRAVVSAVRDDNANGVDAGSAYVFERGGATWQQVAHLVASDGAAGDGFGHAVAFAGEHDLIGAAFDDDNGSDSGSAYLFTPEALALAASGTCPGPVSVTVSNAPPGSRVAVIAAGSTNGYVKGGSVCNGVEFEIGEPIQLPPLWIKTDATGQGTGELTVEPGHCWLEALAATGCETSGAVQVP